MAASPKEEGQQASRMAASPKEVKVISLESLLWDPVIRADLVSRMTVGPLFISYIGHHLNQEEREILNSGNYNFEKVEYLLMITPKKGIEFYEDMCKGLKETQQTRALQTLQEGEERHKSDESTETAGGPSRGHYPSSVHNKLRSVSDFSGKELIFSSSEGSQKVSWKQGSVFGFGGDRRQIYNVCHYKTVGREIPILVYIQSDRGTPKRLTVDGSFQYGMKNGIMFLVLHDKSQTPYQERFVMNPSERTLANAQQQQKELTGIDFSWISGEYLHNI